MRLPRSVVKELLGDGRYSPEAVEKAGALAEGFLARVGSDARGRATKKTVQADDVGPPSADAELASFNARLEKALARANQRLAAQGQEREKL